MPSPSRIQTELPEDLRKELDGIIATGKMGCTALTEWLNDHGYDISKSSVDRHIQKVEAVAEKIRQSREITGAIMQDLGESATQGKQGRLLVEMTRNLVFDLLMKLQSIEDTVKDPEGNPIPEIKPKDVALLGKGLAELGRALRYDQDFEEKIREQVAREAADKLEGALKKEGVRPDPEALKRIREDVYGIFE